MTTVIAPLPVARLLPDTLVMPPRVVARAGAVRTLLKECAAFGHCGLVVHGRALAARGGVEALREATPAGMRVRAWVHTGGEPTLDDVAAVLDVARAHGAEWIAAVGGGSVLDLGKACAGLMEAPRPPQAYHDGAEIPATRIPLIAVPTTAGTGAEATIVTVLTNTSAGVKKSIRHPSFMARLVLLDPELLRDCPPAVIAAAGMDAFTQALESYVSRGATAFTDLLALEALARIDRSLPVVYRGEHAAAADLLEGSFLAGLALSHARLGLVHGLAHPLGLRWHAPHGLVCAVCLPPVLEFNRPVIGPKYEQASIRIGADLQARVAALLDILNLASPFRGKPLTDVAAIVAEAMASGSTAANPRAVTGADVAALLERLFGR